MKEYKIKIIETLEKVVTVKAENEDDALMIADYKYRAAKKDFILSADDYTNTDFKVVKNA